MAAKSKAQAESNGVYTNRIAEVEKAPKVEQIKQIVVTMPEVGTLPVNIVGISPLLLNRFSEKAKQMMLGKQMKKDMGPKAAKDPEANYNAARYVSLDGWDGVPSTAFKAAIVGACRQAKNLPMTLAKTIVFVEADGYTADGIPLVRIFGEPRMHEAMVRNETGVADIRHRPIYDPWRATIRVTFDLGIISPEQVSALIVRAGLYEGIGEWRPSSKKSHTGTFGRFHVE